MGRKLIIASFCLGLGVVVIPGSYFIKNYHETKRLEEEVYDIVAQIDEEGSKISAMPNEWEKVYEVVKVPYDFRNPVPLSDDQLRKIIKHYSK